MRSVNKGRLQGLVLVVLLVAACGLKFPWKYYGLELPNRSIVSADLGKSLSELCYQEGKLLGKSGDEGWSDKQLTEIRPDATTKLKGILLFNSDFYDAKGDYLKCHNDLIACQKKCPSE